MVRSFLNRHADFIGVVHSAYSILREAYGPQGWWPLFSRRNTLGFDGKGYHKGDYSYPRTDNDRFEISVGAILTQNTAWTNVEKALHSLVFNNAFSTAAIRSLPTAELAQCIRSAGYHNQKAKKLHAYLNYKGPIAREGLLSIWGIGAETADSILLYAFNKPIFVIDAYTRRIFSRMGVISEKATYDEVQSFFHKALPKKTQVYQEFHALIVEHAKQHCRTKPLCVSCPLQPLCEYSKTTSNR